MDESCQKPWVPIFYNFPQVDWLKTRFSTHKRPGKYTISLIPASPRVIYILWRLTNQSQLTFFSVIEATENRRFYLFLSTTNFFIFISFYCHSLFPNPSEQHPPLSYCYWKIFLCRNALSFLTADRRLISLPLFLCISYSLNPIWSCFIQIGCDSQRIPEVIIVVKRVWEIRRQSQCQSVFSNFANKNNSFAGLPLQSGPPAMAPNKQRLKGA